MSLRVYICTSGEGCVIQYFRPCGTFIYIRVYGPGVSLFVYVILFVKNSKRWWVLREKLEKLNCKYKHPLEPDNCPPLTSGFEYRLHHSFDLRTSPVHPVRGYTELHRNLRSTSYHLLYPQKVDGISLLRIHTRTLV